MFVFIVGLLWLFLHSVISESAGDENVVDNGPETSVDCVNGLKESVQHPLDGSFVPCKTICPPVKRTAENWKFCRQNCPSLYENQVYERSNTLLDSSISINQQPSNREIEH